MITKPSNGRATENIPIGEGPHFIRAGTRGYTSDTKRDLNVRHVRFPLLDGSEVGINCDSDRFQLDPEAATDD